MVARILTGKSIRGLINYNESKVDIGTAIPILANRFGLEIEQLKLRHKVARFEHLTKLNSRVKTNAVHIMLNFDQSEIIGVELLQKIAIDYMDKIGFSEQPFLVYKHEDANHPHIHIVTTNIKADASRIDLHNIGKSLSEKARKEIEVEYKLLKAEGRGKEPQIVPADINIAEYGEKQTKRTIYNIVTAVMRSYKFTSFAEYNAVLNSFNIIADRGPEDSVMFQKRGLVYSILDASRNRIGIPFKASSFAGNPVLNKVESKFARNTERRKGYAAPLRKLIESALAKTSIKSPNDLVNSLGKMGVSLVFRQNNEGRIYGVTYVDHNTRCVFNGSDLGKSFSAKAVLDRLHQNEFKGLEPNSIGNNPVNRAHFGARMNTNNNYQSSGNALLHFLFEKPAQVQSTLISVRKKKKKKRLSKNRDISNQI